MTLTPRFTEAVAYALAAHSGQVRKGSTIPYLSHLLAVSAIVLEHGGDEDTAVAALLHDVVEDAGGRPRLADVRARFGDAVAAIVEGCSDADTLPKPPWRGRKEAYIARLAGESSAVQLVSAADKLHNARTLLADHFETGSALWGRFNGGKEGTLWYYRTIVGTYSKAPPALVRELDRVVTALESRAAAEKQS
jgi:(p)ppGpp synthase/HD superfamily hydrolase